MPPRGRLMLNRRTSGMSLQHRQSMMCLVKSLFGIKTMNKVEKLSKCVNVHLVVHLLFMMCYYVTYFH